MAPIGKFSGVTKTSFSKIDNNLVANINKIDNVSLVLGPPPGTITNTYAFYNFELESLHTDVGDAWPPEPGINPILGTDSSVPAWFNGPNNPGEIINNSGANGLNISSWGHPDSNNDTVVGWNSDDEGTPSSGTGPNGGVNFTAEGAFNDSGIANSNSTYLYTETSGDHADPTDDYFQPVFVTGFRFANITDTPQSTNYNLNINPLDDLVLDFWHHAFGDDMGDLHVYSRSVSSTLQDVLVDSTNHSNSNLLGSLLNPGSNFSSTTSPYINVEFSLNHLKDQEQFGNLFHAIYFVYHNNNSNNNTSLNWHGDFAIDNIRITSRAT